MKYRKMSINLSPLTLSQSLLLLLATCIGIVHAGIDISQINVNDIQQQLPAELANTNFTLDDAKKLIHDKCIQVAGENGGNLAYEEIEASSLTAIECISEILNYTAIQEEIVEASPRGELEVVFNKYCNKRPEALQCIESFNSKLGPCLDKDEQDNQEVVLRIIRSLLNFICHRGGDQIALFIAEKGPECLESKREDIEQCINTTFSSYIPKEGLENIKSLPKFVLAQKQCDEIERLQSCVVEKLESCSEITPANIVESMFRFIRNETICRVGATAAKQMNTNSVTATYSFNAVILSSLLTLFYVVARQLKF